MVLRNGYNQTRLQGGDHLRARIYNQTLEAFAPGHVIDHNNGTYTVVLKASWPGRQTISVTLVYRREIIRALFYMRQKVTTKNYCICIMLHYKLKYKYNISLTTLLQEDLSVPAFSINDKRSAIMLRY